MKESEIIKKYFKERNFDLKEEIESVWNMEVYEKGSAVKTTIKYIEKKEGEEGMQRLRERLRSLEAEPPDPDELKDTEWVDSRWPMILTVGAVDVFNWEEEDVFNLGQYMGSVNNRVKIFIKYFVSPLKTLNKATKDWRKHFSYGHMKVKKLDKERQRVVLELTDFSTHPLICIHFKGLFSKIVKMAVGANRIKNIETDLYIDGNYDHLYVIEWE